MNDRSDYLSVVEKAALENDALRQQARAIDMYLSVAALSAMSDELVAKGIETIRSADKAQAKRIRQGLAEAARTLEELLPSPVITTWAGTEDMAEPVEVEMQLLVDVHPDPAAPEVQDAPVVSKWAREILGDDVEDLTTREIAERIYERAGSPSTRKQRNGQKIDPIDRIERRVRGLGPKDIAKTDGTSADSISQWFSRIRQDITSRTAMEPANELDEPVEPSTDTLPSAEPEIQPVTPVPTPLRVAARRVEATPAMTIDHEQLAKNWAKELEFDDEQTEALIDVLNPQYTLELNSTHKSVRHRFRLAMQAQLPALESDELDLTSNEIARLSALFGRLRTPGGFEFSAAPKSVREVSLDQNDYFIPQRCQEVLSALQKIADYLEHADEKQDINQQLVTNLEKAGFLADEIEALQTYLTFDDEGTYRNRSDATRSALRKLEGLLVSNVRKIEDLKIDDERTLPSLRMLTNTAFGVKTIEDIYHKLHQRDASTSHEDIEQLLRESIIKITSL